MKLVKHWTLSVEHSTTKYKQTLDKQWDYSTLPWRWCLYLQGFVIVCLYFMVYFWNLGSLGYTILLHYMYYVWKFWLKNISNNSWKLLHEFLASKLFKFYFYFYFNHETIRAGLKYLLSAPIGKFESLI